MKNPLARNQRGATLVIGLIMLVVITLMVFANLNMSTANLRAAANTQFRDEAVASANVVIQMQVDNPMPSAGTTLVDIDKDGSDDYQVAIAQPECIRATVGTATPAPSSALLGAMPGTGTWETLWNIPVTVASLANSGAAVTVHAGEQILLTDSQKSALCP